MGIYINFVGAWKKLGENERKKERKREREREREKERKEIQ